MNQFESWDTTYCTHGALSKPLDFRHNDTTINHQHHIWSVVSTKKQPGEDFIIYSPFALVQATMARQFAISFIRRQTKKQYLIASAGAAPKRLGSSCTPLSSPLSCSGRSTTLRCYSSSPRWYKEKLSVAPHIRYFSSPTGGELAKSPENAVTSKDGVVGTPIDFDVNSKIEGNESQVRTIDTLNWHSTSNVQPQ